jgi:hypothetical protein
MYHDDRRKWRVTVSPTVSEPDRRNIGYFNWRLMAFLTAYLYSRRHPTHLVEVCAKVGHWVQQPVFRFSDGPYR